MSVDESQFEDESRKFECRNVGRGFDSQPEGFGVAFFATGPGLGLIMYILKHSNFLHTIYIHVLYRN